jgi:hypothetical protein
MAEHEVGSSGGGGPTPPPSKRLETVLGTLVAFLILYLAVSVGSFVYVLAVVDHCLKDDRASLTSGSCDRQLAGADLVVQTAAPNLLNFFAGAGLSAAAMGAARGVNRNPP